MNVPFLDLKAHHQPLKEEFLRVIGEVIDCGAFAGGPYVERFEEEFAAYCQAPIAIGVGSGTEALWLTLLAKGIGPGDEVITAPNSFIATAEAISFTGATPVFADVDGQTYNLDPEKLSGALTPRTRAIIPVHLFGQPADMDPIVAFAREHGLLVVEDAAQAHGAEYRGRRTGNLGDAACFSFYPGKNLGALGEGGAVVTADPELAERIRRLRDHGQEKKYHHQLIGWNGRLDGFQGAALSIKLRHLDANNEKRRSHAAHYHERLAGVENLVRPVEADGHRHVYHIYAVRVPDRDKVIEGLNARGIGCGIHYPVPIHLQEAYRSLGYGPGSFPVAEQFAAQFLSLPMFPEMTGEQVNRVADVLEELVASPLPA